MGKIDNLEQDSILQEEEEKKQGEISQDADVNYSPLDMTIDEIIRSEGEVPSLEEVSTRNLKNLDNRIDKSKYCICFDCEDIFDSESIHLLLKNDFEYYKIYKGYDNINCFCYNQEPFSHMYERKCWETRLFEKFQLFLRRIIKPLNSSPFSESGKCSFFEFETLYSPRDCDAYVYRSYAIVKSNFERFKKAAVVFNFDSYENDGFSEIIEDTPTISIPSSITVDSEVKIVDSEDDKDSIPIININRSHLPSKFFESESSKIDVDK